MKVLRRLAGAWRDITTARLVYWPPRTAIRQFRRSGGVMPRRHSTDEVPVLLSPGRSTRKRPGETWAEAMNRLTEGEDL